jgi:hypothetical protein
MPGVPAGWVVGDEVYGADPGLRAERERRRIGYVLAVARDHHVITGAGKTRADTLAARLPSASWQRLSAGPGAKGHRDYDWAWILIGPSRAGGRHLLIRHSRQTAELAYCRCWSPGHVPLAAYVRVAGRPMDHRGELSGRQGPGRPERASGSGPGPPGTGGSPEATREHRAIPASGLGPNTRQGLVALQPVWLPASSQIADHDERPRTDRASTNSTG